MASIRRGVLAATLVAAAVCAFLLWHGATGPRFQSADAAPHDPRLEYSGPFLNVRPEVAYVGDARCAECHPDITRTYRNHPMGRSLRPIAELAAQQPYNGHHNPFEALGRRHEVKCQGERVWHRQQLGSDAATARELEVEYVIGSGTRGHSYLTQHDGYLFQTPISWYSQKEIWDISPGFREASLPERPIVGACLFCHANRAHFVEGSENQYQAPLFDGHAIGCERCHGPGERHVQAPGQRHTDAGADVTIVNPGRLEPALREAVCEQCHLAGESRFPRRGRGLYDFRPGLPLDDFWAVFVAERKLNERDRAVNHVEQMHASRCFQGSSGRLGCVSCHDPHVAVDRDQRVSHYRDRCLACHQQRGCIEPLEVRKQTQPDDSCIACHMKRYEAADIAHTAATDHRIARRPVAPADGPRMPIRHVVPFYRHNADDPEQARDLGIALVQLIFRGKVEPLSSPTPPLTLLERALQQDPKDVDALEARGGALLLQKRQTEALAAFEGVLALAPRREVSLVRAAQLARQLGRTDSARRYWQQAVEANPWSSNHREELARLLAQEHDWEGCQQQCEVWLRLDPASAEARTLAARCRAALESRGSPR
jgi:hypothetical protein